MSKFLQGGSLRRWLEADPQSRDAVIALIDPETAAGLLRRNTKNRPIAKVKLAMYAQNMRDGRFPVTTSGIGFDSDGALQNGQHRLQACVASGVAFEGVIVKGLEPMSFLYEDVHIKRSLADMLCILKHDNYKVLAGALSCLFRYLNQARAARGETRRGAIEGRGGREQQLPTITSHTAAAQIHEALQLLVEHPGIEASVAIYSRGHANSALIPQSLQATLHYLGARIDRDRTEEFLDALLNGVCRDEGAPVIHLVRLLQNAAVSRSTTLKPERRMAFCLKALRHTLLGRRMLRLALAGAATRKGADGVTTTEPEEFPLLEDLVGATPEDMRRKAQDNYDPRPDRKRERRARAV